MKNRNFSIKKIKRHKRFIKLFGYYMKCIVNSYTGTSLNEHNSFQNLTRNAKHTLNKTIFNIKID